MTGISNVNAAGQTAPVFLEKNADTKARISFENALAAAGTAMFHNSDAPLVSQPQSLPQNAATIQPLARETRLSAPRQQVLQGLYKLIQNNGMEAKSSLDIRR